MIYDGYTQHGIFDNRRISYRPALFRERNEINRLPRTRAVIEGVIERHLVAADSDWRTWPEAQIQALFLICFGVMGPEEGGDWSSDCEWRDVRNLRDGVVLALNFPMFAKRDCSHCKRWWYDDETGKVVTRGKKPLLRPLGTVTLCQTNEGCPKGTPENSKAFSEKNKLAWLHFLECDATGNFPDDPIVKRNAMVIRRAMKRAKAERGR